MFDEKGSKGSSRLNYRKLNEVLKVSSNVLKAVYILVLIGCIYTVFKICQDLKIFKIIVEIISILSPLFIGLVIAWLFNPLVSFLQKKGVKRILAVIIIYIIFIGLLALIIGSILPILYEQIVSFANTIPSLFKDLENFIDNFMGKFSNIDGLDVAAIKSNLINQLENISEDVTSGISSSIVNFIKGFVSGISSFVVGLIIGFFFLLSFENVRDNLKIFVPKKWRKDVSKLVNTVDDSLKNYVVGVLIDAVVIFTICSIVFGLIGLKSPLLFAVFCAITNVIPFVGPYIGAVPALIVAFSMSPTIGILTLIAIVIIQFFEGNFLQEYIMSKTTKLHPVSIIMGLLLFGHYWGIIGMALSTPILAVFKQIYLFFDEKYDFFKNNKDIEISRTKEETGE